MTRTNLLDVVPTEAASILRTFMKERAEPDYRVRQALHALWKSPVPGIDEISTLPAELRDALGERCELPRLELAASQKSTDGTEKFAFRLGDGQEIETVAIPDGNRMTLCISSQAGCALKCSFCATGLMGFSRNLSAFEIAGQVREVALRYGTAPSNIVFMGMGEPLLNWEAVSTALTILNSPDGFGIGARHITVSTVGILPGIQALARRPEQFRLAISVHAPTDALRMSLMPINVKYPLSDVIGAAESFARRVTFEYVMLRGVNDGPEHAKQLSKLAARCGAFVNLIPLHPGGAGSFQGTERAAMSSFAALLRRSGIQTAIRRSRGLDISAACGQLKAERIRRRRPVGAQQD